MFTLSPAALEGRLEEAYRHQNVDGSDSGSSTKTCIICVLGMGVLEQYAFDYGLTLSAAANNWCSDVTSEFPKLTGLCELALSGTITKLEQDFQNKVSPDVSCRTTLTACAAAAPTCKLFGTWPPATHAESERVGVPPESTLAETHQFYADTVNKLLNVQSMTESMIHTKLNELHASGAMTPATRKKLQALQKSGKWIPVPIPDWDQDRYAASFTYRGIQFRGMDCNDKDATIYPGKTVDSKQDATVDTNCNGISGVDSASGLPWEEALCSEYPSRGILAIGDSATAHFSLPPTFITPSELNMSTYSHIIQVK